MTPIDQNWIRDYVDTMLNLAKQLDENNPMREAVVLRADHAMDLVKAWREHIGE